MPQNESTLAIDQDPEPFILNEGQRQALLRSARQAIEQTVTAEAGEAAEGFDAPLRQPAAVFVTLWQQEEGDPAAEESKRLRGCIGRLRPDFPLYRAVTNAAISAATRDPRFAPVESHELDSLIIEIAILSPLEQVNFLEEVVIGRDGLVIEAMGRRGLLLPKVATRLNWDREELLQNVCLKAGLPKDTWPETGQLYRFRTTVFHE